MKFAVFRQQACCAREVQLQRADEDLDGCWRDAERQVQCMAGGKGDKPYIAVPILTFSCRCRSDPRSPMHPAPSAVYCEDLASLRK